MIDFFFVEMKIREDFWNLEATIEMTNTFEMTNAVLNAGKYLNQRYCQ